MFISLLVLLSLLHFGRLYYNSSINAYSLKILLQFELSAEQYRCIPTFIQNAEYETDLFQSFFYSVAALQHCSKSQKNTFDGVHCFVKLDALRQTDQRRYKLYVKLHRRRIFVETKSCVHVVNSDL